MGKLNGACVKMRPSLTRSLMFDVQRSMGCILTLLRFDGLPEFVPMVVLFGVHQGG